MPEENDAAFLPHPSPQGSESDGYKRHYHLHDTAAPAHPLLYASFRTEKIIAGSDESLPDPVFLSVLPRSAPLHRSNFHLSPGRNFHWHGSSGKYPFWHHNTDSPKNYCHADSAVSKADNPDAFPLLLLPASHGFY